MSPSKNGRLSVTPSRRHFVYRGKPIWLAGHSRLWTLTSFMAGDRTTPPEQQPYVGEVATVAEYGGHLMRVTPYWPSAWQNGVPMPWTQVEPGTFDLSEPDEYYWTLFSDFVRRCADNDIIVQMEVWDRPGLSFWHESRWPVHPFNPGHNVNYGIDVLPDTEHGEDVVKGTQRFYATVKEGHAPQLLTLQTAYVDRLLEACGPMPNVIYCIENEGWGGAPWENYWAKHIRSRVPDALVTAMPHEPTDNTWTTYFDPSTYSCLDGGGTGLRTATRGEGQGHEDMEPHGPRSRTDQFIQTRECMTKYNMYMQYEPDKAMPIYVSNSFGKRMDSIWTMFCCGAAGFRYHRSTWDDSNEVYGWMKAFDTFVRDTKVPFTDMQPAHERLRGYGLLLHNHERFVMYLPTTRTVEYMPDADASALNLRFFDPATGTWLEDTTVEVPAQDDRAQVPVVVAGRSDTGTVVYGETRRS